MKACAFLYYDVHMTDTSLILKRLASSRFRASFHLGKEDIAYIDAKGMDTIRRHCEEMIRKNLAPSYIANDGRQTPMKGHPVFRARHACACCCRGCLKKWYGIPGGRELTETEIRNIVKILTAWIEREYLASKQNQG